jgi:selenide,water dikinase
LEKLPHYHDPRVLIGFDTSDDAGVYLLTDDIALVHTVDFFTPVVDDPFTYGQISAANSLSDIYAMGATPISALNIVCFPKDQFPLEVLSEILRGGLEKAAEAHVPIIGGHSVTDIELKYGLSVTGRVHPRSIITNSGARVGDLLFLTKPLGTGTITTALKAGQGTPEMEKNVCDWMKKLNRDAADACVRVGVHACTDITGFGLLGHALEMAAASHLCFNIEFNKIPFMKEALDTIRKGFVPGGTKSNLLYVSPCVLFPGDIQTTQQYLLCDPQTSGGLLVAVAQDKADALNNELINNGVMSKMIGSVTPEPKGKISII